MDMPIKKAIVALALGLLSANAAAQTYFLGGSLGKSDIDESLVSGLITSGSIDGKDTAFKVYGGGFFGKHLGAELAYIDLGEASYSGTFFSASVSGGRASVWGYNVAALFEYPVGERFSLFGKLGVFLWESEQSDVFDGTPTSNTLRGWDFGSFGVGATWRFTRSLSARVEWEKFPVGDADASLLSLGVQYSF
jgi:OmpA-OmpF porin, OOP family